MTSNLRKIVRIFTAHNNRYLYIKLIFLLLILLLGIFILSDKLLLTPLRAIDAIDYSRLVVDDSKANEFGVNSINENGLIENRAITPNYNAINNAISTHSMPITQNNNENLNKVVVNTIRNKTTIRFGVFDNNTMKIAITVCGEDRVPQSLVTLKSAILLTSNKLHFVIMADQQNIDIISHAILSQLPNNILKRISFEIHTISFPNTVDVEQWKKLFKLCASQRLFLPTLLTHIDAILYVDTDVIFLTPIDQIWGFFAKFNASQMAAMSRESEDFASNWYHRFAKHPYVEPLGVNSGVMLMNLTRMRAFNWNSYLQPLLTQYKFSIVWGDQDIINIIFHYNGDKLFTFACNWNYRPDHCIYSPVCKEAQSSGVFIIHGNRGVFLNDKQPAFRAVYHAFQDFEFGSDLTTLLKMMKTLLTQNGNNNCGKTSDAIMMAISRVVNAV